MKKVVLSVPHVLTFIKVNGTRLSNSLHVQYHRKQYDLVMAVDKTKLKLPTGLPEAWNEGITYETKIDRESALSVETAKIEAKDRERDDQLLNIFYIIRGQKRSHVENVREAALRLSAKLRPYEDIRPLAYEIESSRLIGMEDDISTLTAEIATLGLTDAFNNLHKLNTEFEKLHVARRTDAADTQLPLATEIRPQTDAAYDAVCQYIQAAYLYAATDDDRALIEQLVDRMNKNSETFKIMQRNLVVSRKPKDPKDPKQPKDPKPKPGGGDDIHLPEEPPKKPDEEQPKPNPGGGDTGGDDIQIPSEPPKKPDGQG